tara:strand:+ start:1745 stop:1936 length:192 start_codon:yes stop_codon:yes gene_type:complete
MWIVYWTIKKKDVNGYSELVDEYHLTSEGSAKTLYAERIKLGTTYTAGYAKIVESTEPHHVNP